jgi:flagellar export protein FliJ
MKKFHFPLERVLALRLTQAKVEEAKLGQLRDQVNAIDRRRAELRGELEQARRHLVDSGGTSGAEFAALGTYRNSVDAQSAALLRARQQGLTLIEQQRQVVAARRRESRLLENLRERRLAEWTQAAAKEEQAQAEESYLSRWNTRR